MNSKEKKTYFSVLEISEEFRKWIDTKPQVGPVTNTEALLWQARCQLAIAQQLTMIAQHLSRIVNKADGLES